MIKIFIDAATNPKLKISAGAMLVNNNHSKSIQTFDLLGKNNHYAELEMLNIAIQHCSRVANADDMILIFSDSKITVDSFRKRYVKDSDLATILNDILIHAEPLKNIWVEWIPEHQNKEADHHAKQTLRKRLKKHNR